MRLSRGDIFLVSPAPGADPRRRRPVVVVSRQTLCDSKADKVVCAPINNHAYGQSTEVDVGPGEGLKHDSVINCDQLVLVSKSSLTHFVAHLPNTKILEMNAALRVALNI